MIRKGSSQGQSKVKMRCFYEKKATTFAAKNKIETGRRRHLCRIIRKSCQCIYQFDKTPSIAQFDNPAANASSRPPSVLFYFVPQEKGLIWRPPWGWKNMRESILHWEDGPPWGKMHPNRWGHMPGSHLQLSELFFGSLTWPQESLFWRSSSNFRKKY